MVSTADDTWFRIEHESSVGVVRRAAVGLARRLGLGDRRAGEIGIAVTEVATNQLKHAGGGTLLLRACRSDHKAAVAFVAMDHGPGMSDVGACLADGHSTSGTLGIGLGAISRLSSMWDIYSLPGRGTVVAASFGLCDPTSPVARAGGLARPMSGQEVCGDAFAVRIDDAVLTAVVADGLGHGPLAAKAADAAVSAFLRAPPGPPVELLTAMHRGAHRTRGAAASVVQVAGDGAVCYAGVGNVSGYVFDGRQQRRMISYPGIVGVNVRVFRETTYDLPDRAIVLLHSDGVTNKLRLDEEHVGLLVRSPVVIAATVLRDFGSRNDDASVLVLGPPAAA